MVDTSLKSRAVELERLMNSLPDVVKKLDDQFYVFESMVRMLDMSADCGQRDFNYDVLDRFVKCERIVKLNRVVPVKLLDKFKIEYVFLSGIYARVECLIINKTIMESYFEMTPLEQGKDESSRKFKKLFNPVEDLNFPDGYRYETVKVLPNGYGIVLKESRLTPSYLGSARSYDYLWLE